MKKLKALYDNLLTNMIGSFKEYPITNASMLTGTIILLFTDLDSLFMGNTIFVFLVAFVAGSLFIESDIKESWRLDAYIVNTAMSLLLTYTVRFAIPAISAVAMRSFYCYVFSLLALSLLQIINNKKKAVAEYFLRVFDNLLYLFIIYLVLNVGLTIIFSLFEYLIVQNYNYDFIFRLQIALLGLYLCPAGLVAITDMNNEIKAFTKFLVNKILLVLVDIVMIVLYVYMINIIIVQSLPVNEIYIVVLFVFLASIFTWLLINNSQKTNKFIAYNVKLIPLALIPLVVLQFMSLLIRIILNAFTPIRYLGLLFIIFEIAILVFVLYKHSKYLKNSLYVLAVLIIIATISPLNYVSVTLMSQANIITHYLTPEVSYNELSDTNKNKVVNAYNYMKGYINYKQYLPSYLTSATYESLDKATVVTSTFYYHYDDDSMVDVSPYTSMVTTQNEYYDQYDAIFFTNYDTAVDLTPLINNIINLGDNADEYVKEHHLIALDANHDLYINYISFTYNYFNIRGYILTKN